MEKPEAIRPAYYKLKTQSTEFDVFDLVRAIQEKAPFSFELTTAIKYIIRLKSDAPEKRINDLEKAAECLNREIEYLKAKRNCQPKVKQLKLIGLTSLAEILSDRDRDYLRRSIGEIVEESEPDVYKTSKIEAHRQYLVLEPIENNHYKTV